MAKRKSKLKKPKNNALDKAKDALNSGPLYLAVCLLWVTYVYLTFHSPSNSSQEIFKLSKQTIDILRITVALPYLVIWLTAIYSFIKMKRYSLSIAPSKEGLAFGAIANGILILAASLIASTLISSVRAIIVSNNVLRENLTILTNYSYVFPYLLAFGLLYYGAREMSKQLAIYEVPVKSYFIWGIPFIIFTYYWLESIFTNPNRMVDVGRDITATYYLKDSLVIMTIVLPSLAMWGLGFSGLVRLRLYYQQVTGLIFKRALSFVVTGFSGIIIGSVFLQALLALGTQRLVGLGLGPILLAIYLFLAIQLLGFFFLAKGAKKLTDIEKA